MMSDYLGNDAPEDMLRYWRYQVNFYRTELENAERKVEQWTDVVLNGGAAKAAQGSAVQSVRF